MINRRFLAAMAVGLAVPGLAPAACTRGTPTPDYLHAAYLSFDGPVRLPGVTLGAGTYIFELGYASGPAGRAVRVLSRDRSKVFFVAFARAADWPAGSVGDPSVTFGEAAGGAPRPIAAWYPHDPPTGLRFIYPGQ